LSKGLVIALAGIGLLAPQFAFGQDGAFAAPRRNAWKVLGPGGGGAQFNPTLSAVDPSLVLVNCDMTGSYISTDGGGSWRMFNLRGVVRFFVADPLDSKILYAATQGLYRSSDKGNTWDLVYPAPSDVASVVISGDHGDERIQSRAGSHAIVDALAVDPADSKVLFAAISKEKKAGLYRSADWGKTWQSLAELPSPGARIYVDAESPKGHRTVYVAEAAAVGVFENGGWRNQKGPDGVKRFLDISGGFPGGGKKPVFYAVSGMNWRGGDTGVTGLFVSVDGGAAWQTIPVDFLSIAPKGTAKLELRAVGTSLEHPETAYLSFRDRTSSLKPADRNMGVAKTVDMGQSWQMVWRDTDTVAAPNVKDDWLTRRYGPDWGENPFALGVSPVDPDICFGTDFGRTMRTKDGGKTWQGVYSHQLEDGSTSTTGLDVLTTFGIFFDPFDVSHWFVGFSDMGLFESRGSGQSWKEATSRGIPREWENTGYWAVFDPEVQGRIWAAMSGTHDLPRPKMWRGSEVKSFRGGIVLSEDGGRTWKASVEGMPQTAPTHILLDSKSPADARTLYVCAFGKGVYKSTDGGRHWTLKNTGVDGSEPFAWRMVQDSHGQLYLLVARRAGDASIGTPLDGALYRSPDGAEHWQRIPLPVGSNAPNGMAIDPEDPNRLYLAAWGRPGGAGDTGGGIFVSTDAGKSWKNVLEKDQHVFDVTVDPRKPGLLYATGFESSVWKSVNRGETWSRVTGYNFKWGQRVFPDPQNPGMIYVCTYGGSIWHGPADGDTEQAEDIATPIMRPER
jgi:photosystem II stability/assembly factor-like uncharacterized protein